MQPKQPEPRTIARIEEIRKLNDDLYDKISKFHEELGQPDMHLRRPPAKEKRQAATLDNLKESIMQKMNIPHDAKIHLFDWVLPMRLEEEDKELHLDGFFMCTADKLRPFPSLDPVEVMTTITDWCDEHGLAMHLHDASSLLLKTNDGEKYAQVRHVHINIGKNPTPDPPLFSKWSYYSKYGFVCVNEPLDKLMCQKIMDDTELKKMAEQLLVLCQEGLRTMPLYLEDACGRNLGTDFELAAALPVAAAAYQVRIQHPVTDITEPETTTTEIPVQHRCANLHSEYMLIPAEHFEKLRGILAWEAAYLYTFAGVPTVHDVLPRLQDIVQGELEPSTTNRRLYIAVAMIKATRMPYMLLAVEHDLETNLVWQAYIHRFHYALGAPTKKAPDLHRAVWYMLQPSIACLQAPRGGNEMYRKSYMETVLEGMEEWDKDDPSDTLYGTSALFNTPEYHTTLPHEHKNVKGKFHATQNTDMQYITFNFVRPDFAFTWESKQLRMADDTGRKERMQIHMQREKVKIHQKLKYRIELAKKLGPVGIKETKHNGTIVLRNARDQTITLLVRDKCVWGYLKNGVRGKTLPNTQRNPHSIITAFLNKSLDAAEEELLAPLPPPVEE